MSMLSVSLFILLLATSSHVPIALAMDRVRSSENAAENAAESAAEPLQPVGLLWVTFVNRLGGAASAKGANYIQQTLASATSAAHHNPTLPLALATNLRINRAQLARRFHHIIPLGPFGLGSRSDWARRLSAVPPRQDTVNQVNVTSRRSARTHRMSRPQKTKGPHRTKGPQNPWLVRLHALEKSPFELTLEIDASATFCSAELHHLLVHEHRLSRLDFAVNFESTPLVPKSAFGSRRPNRVEEILPHNFAMLLRKGPGLDRLLCVMKRRMSRFGGDDQQGLRSALTELAKSDSQPCGSTKTASCGGRGGGGRGECTKVQTKVRVWRLKENVLGFKSADKTKTGGAWVWPRFSRPIAGAVQVVHSIAEVYSGSAANRSSTVCESLNEQQASIRMALQATKRERYVTVRSRDECLAHLVSAHTRAREKHVARKPCSQLPANESAGGALSELVEPRDVFWRAIHRIYTSHQR